MKYANIGNVPPSEQWTIRFLGDMGYGPEFALIDPSGEQDTQGPRPRELAKHAWAEGAQAVIHDYDLTKDPEG